MQHIKQRVLLSNLPDPGPDPRHRLLIDPVPTDIVLDEFSLIGLSFLAVSSLIDQRLALILVSGLFGKGHVIFEGRLLRGALGLEEGEA